MTAYGTINGGETYFQSRLHSDAWDTATATKRQKALNEGTLIIDRLNFLGKKQSEDQENQFPRYNDSTTPLDIQYANYEIALALLDGVDPDMEYENLYMQSQQYANVRSTYDRSRIPENIAAGVPSIRAWRYLRPYLRDQQTLHLNRIS